MQQIILSIIAIIASLGILGWSTSRFVEGASGLARGFNVSPMVIGLTIVAFGTSTPEVLVSAMAALQGNSGIAIGNVVGSNITNMTLVVGVTALITPLTVHSQTLRKEFPLMLLVMLAALVLIWDGVLSRADGLLLLAGMVMLIFWTIRLSRRASLDDPLEVAFSARIPEIILTRVAWWRLFSGLVLLLISSRLLVWGATSIAHTFGVSDLIVGLTIVAVGGSLPELAASVAAARKGENDIAIGNIVGSNLYNILAALGITGIIGPGRFDTLVLTRDYPLMFGLSVALYFMARGSSDSGYGGIQRWEGGLLLIVFISYQIWLFISATVLTAY
jgi:cation:H+ antiporter